MTQGTNVQQKFGGGELDPKLHERYDIQQYDASIGDSLNVMSTNKGDLISRPGTELVKQNTTGESVRVIPFVFSNDTAFRLEFTNQTLKIYQGDTQISSSVKYTWDENQYDPDQDGTHYAGTDRPRTFPFQVGDEFTIGTDNTGTLDLQYNPGAQIANTNDSTVWEVGAIDSATLGTLGITGTVHLDDITVYQQGGSTEMVVVRTGGSPNSTIPATLYWEFSQTEWQSPYLEAELQDIQFTGAGDVMFFTHPNHQPMKLTRVGDNDFTFHPHYTVGGPWKPERTYGLRWNASTSIYTAHTGGSGNVWTPVERNSGKRLDPDYLLGRMVRCTDVTTETGYVETWYTGEISSVASTNDDLDNFTATIWLPVIPEDGIIAESPPYTFGGYNAFPGAGQVDQLKIGYLFEEDPGDGTGAWPACVEIWEGRLIYGGSTAHPTTIAFSRKNDFDNFEPDDRGRSGANAAVVPTGSNNVRSAEVRETDSFVYSLSEGDASLIQWIKGTPRGLMVATENHVHISAKDNSNSGYSSNNFNLRISSYDGATNIQPEFIEGRVYYVNKHRNKIMSLGFDFSTDVYASREESIFSDHLFDGEIESLAFARDPIQVLWMTLSTGDLISMVMLSEQEQKGFFKHRIAGPQYSYNSSTDSNQKTYIHSICVLPNNDVKPSFDQLYLATERDSATDADFIERLTAYPMNRDINLFNTLDMSINPFTESSTVSVTAVDREDTAGVETLTLTAAGHGLSATDTFALGNFEGGYSYLNGGALYTVDSVSGDDVIVTPARTPGGPTDYSEPYSGTGYIFKQDLTHTVPGDAFQLSEPDMIEKGILVDPDDYSWALSGSDSVLTMSSTTEGFIYSFGYYPDIYITTLPDNRANQQGRGEPYFSGITKLLFKLINTRNLTVQRVSNIQTTLSIPLVVSPATQTAGESAIYLDGKYEILPEQTQDDREAEFKIVPETGYPINILSIYKRGEKASR